MEQQEYKIMYDLEENHWWYITLHNLVDYYVSKFTSGRTIRILDAGCGTGRMLQILKEHSFVQGEGIDFSEQAIHFSKMRGLEQVLVQDLTTWNPLPEKYDIIISLDVLCSVDRDLEVLKKFEKALKPGGILILNLPAFSVLRRNHDELVWSKRRYSKNQTKNNLENFGFKITRIGYRLPYLFFILLSKKIIEKIFKIKPKESDLKNSSRLINNIFKKLGTIENILFTKGISLPIGSSLFVVARKN